MLRRRREDRRGRGRAKRCVASEKGQRKIEGGWEGRAKRAREKERERTRRRGKKGTENRRVGKGSEEREEADGRGDLAEVKTWKCSMAVGNR